MAKVPDIAGCYSQGKTVEEAVRRVKEAIQACLEADEQSSYDPLKFHSWWQEPHWKYWKVDRSRTR